MFFGILKKAGTDALQYILYEILELLKNRDDNDISTQDCIDLAEEIDNRLHKDEQS